MFDLCRVRKQSFMEIDHEIFSTVILSLGVVGCGKCVMYLTSLGHPADIGLHLGKACCPCSR